MASRQALIKPFEWGKLLERVGPEMKSKVNTFKSKSDTIFSNYNKARETKVAIDWAYYRQAVTNKALVEEFEKKFKAFEVPRPTDTKSSALEAKAKEDAQQVKKFIADSEANLVEVKADLDRLTSLPPFEQMTMDDVYEHLPRLRPDYEKHPYWPHRANVDEIVVAPK